MRSGIIGGMMLLAVWLLAGCQEHIRPSDMTFDRGAQLLAAGSPQTAIPFLTQTVAATADGPEPLALLALAYSLDHQPERALAQVRLVKRLPGESPGWENIATGIAQMSRHIPEQAIMPLETVAAAGGPLAGAASQWLILAQLMNNQPDASLADLEELAGRPGMQTTSLLWISLVQAHERNMQASATALTLCAQSMASPSAKRALATGLANADDQTLYDAGIAALGGGDWQTARKLFEQVKKNSEYSDAPVWLAMITVSHDPWIAARGELKEACEKGSAQSRGLANQLFSVVCALENRPDAMIQHTLAGQRILNRMTNSSQPTAMPEREEVWNSDRIKQ